MAPMAGFRKMALALLESPRFAVGMILLAGIALRLAFFLEMRDTPYYQQHEWVETDMAFFDQWSDHLAAGNWLDEEGQHPFHGWHRLVASRHFQRAGVEPPEDGGRALWQAWYGGPRFHQEPLYAYLLALSKALGLGLVGFLLFQALLGLASNVLVYFVTRRAFGPTTGLIAAGLALLFAPFLFYEGLLLRAAPLLFAGLGTLLLAQRVSETPSPGRLVAAGLGLGAAMLLKSTFLLFALVLVVVVAVDSRDRHVGLRRVGWLLGGLVLPLLPAMVRNLLLGVSPLALSSVGTVTFINANAADFVPGSGFFISQFCEPLMASHHASFSAAAAETLRTHDSIWTLVLFLLKKTALFFVPWEIPNNANLHYYQAISGVLGPLQLGFLWVGIPAVAGVVLALRAGRRALLPLAAFLCSYAPLVAFYNLSRFRAPVVGLMLPFAGLAIVQVIVLARARRWLPLAAMTAGVAVVAAGVLISLPDPSPRIRPVDYHVANKAWRKLIAQAEETEGPEAALAVAKRSLATAPTGIRNAVKHPPEPSAVNRTLAREFGPLYLECARLAAAVNDEASGLPCFEQAKALHKLAK